MCTKIIILLSFMIMFLSIGVWLIFRPNAGKHYEKLSKIPLNDTVEEEHDYGKRKKKK